MSSRCSALAVGRVIRWVSASICLLVCSAFTAEAQMIVSGVAVSGNRPADGATIEIRELGLSTRATSEGIYNLLIPAPRVRGQRVTIEARHRRFGSQSTTIVLNGDRITVNFNLTVGGNRPPENRPPVAEKPSRRDTTVRAPATTTSLELLGRRADSSQFGELAGPVDFSTALAGRIAGLTVTAAPVPGGASPMWYRGPRSLTQWGAPLVVVDGVPIDNAGFTTLSQTFGQGGFDYGSPLQDIALDDIAHVTMMDGVEASLRYGARAANGVLLVATREGGTTRGVSLNHRFLYTSDRPDLLPSYQNQYGQGLDGQFEFFDGAGGGINDGADQSWGPKLEGQPVIQGSLIEPRRPDVRAWLPRSGNVRQDFLEGGHTLDGNIGLVAVRDPESARLSLGARSTRSVTPGQESSRYTLAANGTSRRLDPLTVHGSVQLSRTNNADRPGSGFDEVNPIAGFTRIGRQVDVAALGNRIKDTVEQVNWIYTNNRNNPWFQSRLNSNDDHRGHVTGATDFSYDIGKGATAVLRAGMDMYHESRNLQVESGWKGGYPTPLGRADFSGGGAQQEKLSVNDRVFGLAVNSGTLSRSGQLHGSVGVEVRRSEYERAMTVDDSSTLGAGSRIVTDSLEKNGMSVGALFVGASATPLTTLRLRGGVRLERWTDLSADQQVLYPSIAADYDVLGALPDFLRGRLGAASLRASWWTAGNEVTPRSLERSYVMAGPSAASLLSLVGDSAAGREQTSAIELGALMASTGQRVSLNLGWYSEQSSDVLVGRGAAAQPPLARSAEISNSGLQGAFNANVLRDFYGVAWDFTALFAHNTNKVEKLAEGITEVPLGPPMWGATLVARERRPVGVITGAQYLRDGAGALVLKNGLPLPDVTAPSDFGTWQPNWTVGVASTIRYGKFELTANMDARLGGNIFSATNLWGSYSGTLSSTLNGRETGFVIPGVDSVSGAANSTQVTGQDYYHALGAIQERWVYDATYLKLRNARITYELPLDFVPFYRQQSARISIVGRNLWTWAKAPNIDPETAVSGAVFQGFELGQLPGARSIGLQLSVTP
ncbi:MAG TPA: TonB-dependent receptor plug domain-containing protein [Gemmatimonadaceae bacterium]|nr:TonB-dependent receptor plug domain-containing protein [Gemmatimonadaceae bacterium]